MTFRPISTGQSRFFQKGGVDLTEQFDGLDNAFEVFPFDAQLERFAGSRAQKNGPVFFQQGLGVIDGMFEVHAYAEGPDVVRFLFDDGLGKPVRGNAVGKHPSGILFRFEKIDVVTEALEVRRRGKPCGSGSDDRDGNFLGRKRFQRFGPFLPFFVRGETLKEADLDRARQFRGTAPPLAKNALRADPRTDPREDVGFLDDFDGAREVPGGDLPDELGHVHLGGAAFHARGVLAFDAPRGFRYGFLRVESFCVFLEGFGQFVIFHGSRSLLTVTVFRSVPAILPAVDDGQYFHPVTACGLIGKGFSVPVDQNEHDLAFRNPEPGEDVSDGGFLPFGYFADAQTGGVVPPEVPQESELKGALRLTIFQDSTVQLNPKSARREDVGTPSSSQPLK